MEDHTIRDQRAAILEDEEMKEIVVIGEIVIEIGKTEGIEGIAMIEEMVSHIEMMTVKEEMIVTVEIEIIDEIETIGEMVKGMMITEEKVDQMKEMQIVEDVMIADQILNEILKGPEIMIEEGIKKMAARTEDRSQTDVLKGALKGGHREDQINNQMEALEVLKSKVILIDRKIMAETTGKILVIDMRNPPKDNRIANHSQEMEKKKTKLRISKI